MRKLLLLAALAAPAATGQVGFINEFHYDNAGTDVGEFVEVALQAGQTISDYAVIHYNGSNGTIIRTDGLSGFVAGATNNGYTLYSFTYPANGLQNDTEGLALVNTSTNTVVEFLCYEGTLQATAGIANGQTCSDAGVSEVGVAAGSSIARTGPAGSSFAVTTDDTPGQLNAPAGQTALPVELTSFTAATDGAATVLRWTTESETNNAGFAVEQERGLVWSEVGFVAGRGTTSERSQYAHTVAGLTAGTYRFRLRQTDFDGTTSYSATVEVAIGLDRALDLGVVGRTVRFAVREAQAVRAELFNALGQRIAVLFDAEAQAGVRQTVAVDDNLTPGVYFVRVTGGRATQTARVAVTR